LVPPKSIRPTLSSAPFPTVSCASPAGPKVLAARPMVLVSQRVLAPLTVTLSVLPASVKPTSTLSLDRN